MTNIKKDKYKESRLQQLRGFCYTAQLGQVSKAAEKMHLTQPSVSLQIKALETELNTTLFERHGPTISLTEAGKTLYKIASPLVESVDAIVHTFLFEQGQMQPSYLNIAAGGATCTHLLPPYLKTYLNLYPQIKINLHNLLLNADKGIDLLHNNEVECVIGSFLEMPDDLDFYPIKTYDTVLITPKGHPLSSKKDITLEDISQYDLILPNRRVYSWQTIKSIFQLHNLPFKVKIEVDGWESIKQFVALGIGISVVTSICIQDETDIDVIPLNMENYVPPVEYGIIARKNTFLSPQAKAFITLVKHGI